MASGDLIAHDQRTPFSLTWPVRVPWHYPFINRKALKALVVVSNPSNLKKFGLKKFDANATVAGLRQALGDVETDVLALDVEDKDGEPNLKAIKKFLKNGQYTLLHLVAHGRLRDGETDLFLVKENGEADPIKGAEFIGELSKLEELPHVIFLATCESAAPEAGLGNLAQRMTEQLGTPAILAMTDKVSIDTATDLAETFYQDLAEHGEADRALVQSLTSVDQKSELTVPVLYSQLEGSLFEQEEPEMIKAGVPMQRPTRAENFTGREEDLAWLMEALQPGRAVTVWASGGMGKTALSAEALWRLAPGDEPPERFPDGFVFYSFYGRPETAGALEHIVRSFDEEAQDVSEDAARRILAGKRALLVLDGAEEAADLRAVLRLRDSNGALITTRKREDAPDHRWRWELKPLPGGRRWSY